MNADAFALDSRMSQSVMTTTLHTPAGDEELTVVAIDYAAS